MSRFFVQGDAKLLQSAIENLVRNAIRYTEPGTPVEVLLQSERRLNASFVRLTVRDYGPGVPESELVNIFQPFYRVSDARDRQTGGAGLGLAIAERVIRVHGGTIRAENATPRGLRVEVLLPHSSTNSPDPASGCLKSVALRPTTKSIKSYLAVGVGTGLRGSISGRVAVL